MFNIDQELKKVPHKSGVYVMKEMDQILYIGKAVDLHNRLKQYFPKPLGRSAAIYRMVDRVDSFEYIVTDSEMEALILENNLIKQHKPPYNTLLKDDKQYPYIKVTVQEPFPRIYKTRTILKDKARYFGPYTSGLAVKSTLELMEEIWPLRNCNRNLPRDIGKMRPCLNYHIGKCKGPCIGKISQEDYQSMVDKALRLLSGHHKELLKELEEKMRSASEALDFEAAAQFRDQIKGIEHLSQTQKIEHAASSEERDIIAFAREDDMAMLQIFFVRGGKLTGREHFLMESASDLSEKDLISAFVTQFYSGTAYIPREILLEQMPQNQPLLEEYLSAKRGSRVTLLTPVRGEKTRLVALAKQNAILTLTQFGTRLKSEEKRTLGAVAQLQALLGLEDPPSRLEAYDISNTLGTLSVGSMIVFEEGRPKTSDYRKFRIQTVEGPDDYASMEEVLTRRFQHALTEIKELSASGKDPSLGSFTRLPDLILMDGGKGQVHIAEQVLQKLDLEIPVAGMVKDDHHRTRGLYYNDKEIDFGSNKEAFLLVTRVQDEAHRFAITYHRKLRADAQLKSKLDQIPGIGPARRGALLKAFGSTEGIAKATLEELKAVPSMNEKAALAVASYFTAEKKNL